MLEPLPHDLVEKSLWLPRATVGLIINTLMMDKRKKTDRFEQAIQDACCKAKKEAARHVYGHVVRHQHWPSRVSVYTQNHLGLEVAYTLDTHIFLTCLLIMGRHWAPSVQEVAEIPDCFIEAFIKTDLEFEHYFPNLRSTTWHVTHQHWLARAVAPAIYLSACGLVDTKMDLVSPDGSLENDGSTVFSSFTDVPESMVSINPLAQLYGPQPINIFAQDGDHTTDAITISALLWVVSCDVHAHISTNFDTNKISKFCRDCQRHNSPDGDNQLWWRNIPASQRTVGTPNPMAIYKRLVDMFNDAQVARPTNTTPTKYVSIRDQTNFKRPCFYCRMYSIMFDEVLARLQHKRTTNVFIEPPSGAFALREAMQNMPSDSQRCMTYLAIIMSPKSLSPEQMVSYKKDHIFERALSLSGELAPAYCLTEKIHQANDLFGGLRENVREEFRDSRANWSTQKMTLLMQVDMDAACTTLPTDTAECLAAEDRAPSPDLGTTTYNTFVLDVAHISDLQATALFVGHMLKQWGIPDAGIRYSLSNNGRFALMHMTPRARRLVTGGIYPLASMSHYAEIDSAKAAVAGPTHLQALRNMFDESNDMVFMALLWLRKVLFTTKSSDSQYMIPPHKTASFYRYRYLPVIMNLFTPEEIFGLLQEPYRVPGAWDNTQAAKRKVRKALSRERGAAMVMNKRYFSIYTCLNAFLAPDMERVCISHGALNTIWYALCMSKKLWKEHRFLAGFLCEMQVFDPSADTPPRAWQTWVKQRKKNINACANAHGAERHCTECDSFYASFLYLGHDEEDEYSNDPTVVVKCPYPPYPYADQVGSFPVSEDAFYQCYQPRPEYNLARFCNREVDKIDGYSIIPDVSRIFIGLEKRAMLGLILDFVVDQEVPDQLRKRAFLGIHTYCTKHKLVAAMRPVNADPGRLLYAHQKLHHYTYQMHDKTVDMNTSTTNTAWCRQHTIYKCKTDPRNPLILSHYHHNFKGFENTYFLFLCGEAMMQLDAEPKFDPGRWQPLCAGFYGKGLVRSAVDIDAILRFHHSEHIYQHLLDNAPLNAGYVLERNPIASDAVSVSPWHNPVPFECCLPIWRSPCSPQTPHEVAETAKRRNAVSPFAGSNQLFLPVILGYPVLAARVQKYCSLSDAPEKSPPGY